MSRTDPRELLEGLDVESIQRALDDLHAKEQALKLLLRVAIKADKPRFERELLGGARGNADK